MSFADLVGIGCADGRTFGADVLRINVVGIIAGGGGGGGSGGPLALAVDVDGMESLNIWIAFRIVSTFMTPSQLWPPSFPCT